VAVRPYPPDGARVTIGDREANDALLAVTQVYPHRH
jgi:histidinol-phosphate/aromatic aminotransferase/cobyric acid decarboxylase-like protein